MEALKRLSLAFAALALGAVGCGDDDGGGDTTKLDGSIDGAVTDASHSDGSAADASAFQCASYTRPTANTCGGSHCLQTPAELKASVSSSAVCKTDGELDQFCQLSSVDKVTTCVSTAFTSGKTGEDLKTATRTCAAAELPAYSTGCLDCFIDSAICAANNCIAVCYPTSATAACDECRVSKGCIPNFYTCSGIKNPIPGF